MTESTEKSGWFKMGISLWLSFCLFICLWFLSRFMKGRRQLNNNLHVIEDGLRRMQDEIERRQRENSMGYGENLEDLAKEWQKKDLEDLTKEIQKDFGKTNRQWKYQNSTYIIQHHKPTQRSNVNGERTKMAYLEERIRNCLGNCPCLISKLSTEYPNIDNRNLPNFLGCVSMHQESEAKKALQRICFKDVRISSVKARRNNRRPACFWQIVYDLIDPDATTELDDSDDSNRSNPVPLMLPDEQPKLNKLYKDIVGLADFLGLEVVRKYRSEDRYHVIIEYAPRGCQCHNEDFSLVAEGPRMRPDIEVEMKIKTMKL